MTEVNFILIKALTELLQRKISLSNIYTSGIPRACAKLDLPVRSVLLRANVAKA